MKHLFDVVDCLVEQDGKYLIVQETGPGRDGLYNLPGGHIEGSEAIMEAAVREVFEETGYEVELTGFVGLYQTIVGPRDLNVCGPCLTARVTGGQARISAEHPEVLWVTPEELLELVAGGRFWTSYVPVMLDDYQRRGAYPLDAVNAQRV